MMVRAIVKARKQRVLLCETIQSHSMDDSSATRVLVAIVITFLLSNTTIAVGYVFSAVYGVMVGLCLIHFLPCIALWYISYISCRVLRYGLSPTFPAMCCVMVYLLHFLPCIALWYTSYISCRVLHYGISHSFPAAVVYCVMVYLLHFLSCIALWYISYISYRYGMSHKFPVFACDVLR